MTATPAMVPTAYVSKFTVPKTGQDREQCEDAYSVWPDTAVDEGITERFVAAVCDGASESMLAGEWARQLSSGFTARTWMDPAAVRSPRAAADAVLYAAGAWKDWLAEYIAGREAAGRPLSWYEQPKLERGAYATMLVLDLDHMPQDDGGFDELTAMLDAVRPKAPSGWRWHAVALGDTCLFHISGDRLERAFPVDVSAGFGVNPPLVNSRGDDATLLAGHIAAVSGRCEQGDQLYLATDALAAWFLRRCEAGGRPWSELREHSAESPEKFEAFIMERRADGTMRNDDVALIHVDIEY